MRGPFGAVRRWWKDDNGNVNGIGRGDKPRTEPAFPLGHKPLAAQREAPSPEPPWLAQLDREGIPRSLNYPATSLGRLVDQAADRFGDLPALIYNNSRLSYAELARRIHRLAGW